MEGLTDMIFPHNT